jgi:CheY-like chemotaxis protein
MVTLQVDLQHIDEVAEMLRTLPEVRSLDHITGEYDLVAEALFPSQDRLLRFLSETLATLPGVRRSSTAHVLRSYKTIADWTLPEPKGPRILVVDDDPDFVDIIRTALEHDGFEVSTAASGREAITRSRASKPDAIIMDVMMETVLDGLNASREIRSDRLLHDVPVVMVTSIPGSESAAMFPTDEFLPVDAFLTKPVDPARLIDEVRRALRRR